MKIPAKKIKTAAVYDRWLHTLGGGEQAAVGFARMLQRMGYKTSIVSHRRVNREAIEERLGVDLKGIECEFVPFGYDFELGPLTAKYDVFLSNSYLDYIPNYSTIGILSLFFPTPIEVPFFKRKWRRHGIKFLRAFLHFPVFESGFSQPEEFQGKKVQWLEHNECKIVLNKETKNIDLTLAFSPFQTSVIESMRFRLSGQEFPPSSRVFSRATQFATYSWRNLPVPIKELVIQVPKSVSPSKIGMKSWSIPNYQNIMYRLLRRLWPQMEARLHGGHSIIYADVLKSYDTILVNSEFTASWVKKYWNMASYVAYPPVKVEQFSPKTKKKNWIIHIGRFFLGGHNKKQLEMVEAFKKLYKSGITDWEFHLIGAIADGPQHAAYAHSVEQATKGYPIFVHFNVDSSELTALVNQGKLYWHATGINENQKIDPINMEHFGITTVEAMAAGCVPLVYKAGGQIEVVTSETGYLWTSLDELLERTRFLIQHPEEIRKRSLAAAKRSKDFSFAAFEKRFRHLFEALNAVQKHQPPQE